MTTRRPPGPPRDPPELGAYRPSADHTPQARPPQPYPAAHPEPQHHSPHGAVPPPLPHQPQPGHVPLHPARPPYPSQAQTPPYGRPMPPPGGYPPRAGGPRAGGPPPPPRRPGGKPPAPPDRPGGGFLKIITVAVLAVFVLAAVGAAALYLAGPTDVIRNQLIARVKSQTGRDLTIAGPTSFKIWPSLGVAMEDVALSAPPGMTAPPLVTMKSLTVRVGLLPLLQRDITVDELVLTEPVFELRVDKAGRKSWDFAAAPAAAHGPVRLAQLATPERGPVSDAIPATGAADATRKLPLEQLALRDVRVEGGTVHYVDEAGGVSETISGITMQLGLPNITGTAALAGDLVWRGEKLAVDAKLTSPKALLDSAPVQLAADIKGRPLEARYDGTLKLVETLEADGDLALKGNSLKSLLAFAGGQPAGTAATRDNFEINGKLRAGGNTYTLSGLNAAIAKARASGDLAVTTGGARPIVKANLKLAELDLNPYLDGGPPSGAAPTATAPATTAPSAPQKKGGAQSIEDLLEREPGPAAGPQVKGFTQRIGLSTEPLNLTALAAAQADITFDATRILARDITIDRAAGRLTLADRVLKLDIADLKALDGQAKGFFTIDGRAPVAAVGTNLTIDGVSLVPVARIAGLSAVSGTGRIGARIAMAGQGASQLAIAETLAGQSQLTLSGGTLGYETGGKRHNLKGIDLALGVTSLSGPLTAKGGLQWNGEQVGFDGTLSTLKELADARPVAVTVSVTGKPVTAAYNGSIAYADKASANGELSLKTPSVRTLAAWIGTELPEGPGFGPLDLKAKVALQQERYSFKGTRLTLDGDTATGDITVDTAGTRPAVKADLKLTGLDLNKYIADLSAPKPAARSAKAPRETGATPAKAAGPNAAASKAPQVRGYAQRGGWSGEPYDLGALGLVDIDARLTLGRLLYKKIKVGQSAVAVGLKNRVLKTDFTDVQLYKGRGKGMVAVDASDPSMPKIVTNLNVNGIEALPLLKDAADLDWLSGKGKLVLGVTGQGRTQNALVNSLGGSADLAFTDGAIVGINIPGMLRNVAQGKLGGLSSAPTEKTDFSQLSSSWAINRGVARNSDLKLVGPLIRVTGEGAVKIGDRALDYTLKPKLVADATGQGGNMALAGIEVPLRITGPWEKPKFAPDLKGILSDPNKAVNTIKEIGKQFKGKNANEILDGLLGGGSPSKPSGTAPADGGTAPAPKRSKTEELLDQFLKSR